MDLPVVAKQQPVSASAAQLRTAHDIIEAEQRCNAAIYSGGHGLLAVKVTTYDPYKHVTSLVRDDGLIVHEVDSG